METSVRPYISWLAPLYGAKGRKRYYHITTRCSQNSPLVWRKAVSIGVCRARYPDEKLPPIDIDDGITPIVLFIFRQYTAMNNLMPVHM